MLNEDQLKNRRKGIGASESATVLGLNPNMTPYELWLIKTGRKEPEDLSEVPQVQWGIAHEATIAKHYEKVMECRVYEVEETMFHIEHPFMLCHPDRLVENQSKLLECKFAMFARDDWGPSGSDIVPMAYIIQVQHQMSVMGYEEADLAVLISGFDFRVYHFKRDEELISKIIAECRTFWECVEQDNPPPLKNKTDAFLAYPSNDGNFKEAEESIVKIIDEYSTIRDELKTLEEKKENLADKLALYIKESDGIKYNDSILATWKANARGTRVLRVMGA